MDSSADSGLAASLTAFGRTNFSEECTVDGGPARLVMNETHVGLAVADGAATVLSEPFTNVDAAQVPGTTEVSLRLAGRDVSVTFPDEPAAQRFLRVLGVRQEAVNPPSRRAPVVSSARTATRPPRGTPRSRYALWMQNTLLTSTVLLALGWLNLIIGGVLTIVVAVNGRGAVALVWLVVAVGGSSVPFCLGSLARMIVYRYEIEDSKASGTAAR